MKLDRLIAVRNKKTVYRDGNRCIKVFHKSYPQSTILSEALNQARAREIFDGGSSQLHQAQTGEALGFDGASEQLHQTRAAETGIYVPELLEVTSVEGCSAIVSRFVRGKTLQQLLDEEPGRKRELLQRFAGIHLSVAAQSGAAFPSLREKIERAVGRAVPDAAMRDELGARLEQLPDGTGLCHGDFNPTNVIIMREAASVLDWPHAARGDAAADAASTCLLFLLDGDTEGAGIYLAAFCEGSGTDERAVLDWLPVVAAAKSSFARRTTREQLLTWTAEWLRDGAQTW